MIHIGDSLQVLRGLPSGSVQCCITSPPYFGLRDYGVAGQLGREKTPQEFVSNLVEIFREVRRVLRDDGTLWLNLGDSYAANRSYQVPSTKGGKKHSPAQGNSGSMSVPAGMKQKDLIGIPWMVAFALREDGWYLRQDIIWAKPNPMPESVTDRCTKSHEYIFLFSKSPQYYFDAAAIAEPSVTNDTRRPYGSKGAWKLDGRPDEQKHGGKQRNFTNQDNIGQTRNKRSVWAVTTRPFKGAHFATFPPELIRPCILAGAPVGSTVLDPFGGSGTTAQVCWEEDRKSILIDINPNCADLLNLRFSQIKQKNNLTDKQIPVYPSLPPAGHTLNQTPKMHFSTWEKDQEGFYGEPQNTDKHMTTKMLALIAGVLSTALSQIQNICLGGTEPDAPAADPATKAPKKQKAAPAPAPEPEEETEKEEADVTVEVEDGVDYDALRTKALNSIIKLFKPVDQGGLGRADLKPKVKALIVQTGAGNIPEMDDKHVQPFIDAVKKLAGAK